MNALVDYSDDEEDNLRWLDFEFRDGDLVVSTRSKHGTTWTQTICALLIHGTPPFPEPLGRLSPWLDRRTWTRAEVFDTLAAQEHRRIIKTHTPLDGVVLDDRATYLVVAREPLDAAVSLWHQIANLDRVRIAELTGSEVRVVERPPLDQWLQSWIHAELTPTDPLDSLRGVVHHVSDAWRRASSEPNVHLIHYDDLMADLDGEMRRIAGLLGVEPEGADWPALVDAATLDGMRRHTHDVVPDGDGVFIDRDAFLRRGGTSEGWELLTADDVAAYRRRIDELADGAVARWLSRR